jgi:hypothetical protein
MNKTQPDFFERPSTRKVLWILLYATCGLTVVAEFVAHPHPHFGFASFFGFNAVLGFVSCAILILVAKGLGMFIKKREDYYER